MDEYSSNIFGLGPNIRVFRPRQRVKQVFGPKLATSEVEMANEHACYLCNQAFFLLPYFSSAGFFERQWHLEKIREYHLCCPPSHKVFFGDMVFTESSKTIKFDGEYGQHAELLEEYLTRALAYPRIYEARHIRKTNPEIYLNSFLLGSVSSIITKYETDHKKHFSLGGDGLC